MSKLPKSNKMYKSRLVQLSSLALFPDSKLSKTRNHLGQPQFGFTGIFPLPYLQNFSMTIRVNITRKSRTTSRSILGKKPTGFVSNPACITQGLRSKWTGSPLWGLLNLAMAAPPLKHLTPGLNRRSFLWLLGRRFS